MLVPLMLYGNPKYLASLDELINSTEHCEAAVVENGTRGLEPGLSSPKEPGKEKRAS